MLFSHDYDILLMLVYIAGHIYSLHTWGGCMFVSGSQDKTARFWDLRASAAINIVPSHAPGVYYVMSVPCGATLCFFVVILLDCAAI